MNNLIINGKTLPYPKSFKLQKEPNVVCEITTLSGAKVADTNGWRYADTDIVWETLYPEDLQRLIEAVEDPQFQITYHDNEGGTHTVTAILKGFTQSRTLVQYGGEYVWENVGIKVMFPHAYEWESEWGDDELNPWDPASETY